MMKTSIIALLAFSGMLGNADALRLSLGQTTVEDNNSPPAGAVPSIGPTISQMGQLTDMFQVKAQAPADSFGHPRMNFEQFANLVSPYGFPVEDIGCSDIADWMVGGDDTCVPCDIVHDHACFTGTKNTFRNSKVVSCDGKHELARICAQPGLLRHFQNVDPDSEGPNTLSLFQFKQAIQSVNTEVDTGRDGRVYTAMTAANIDADKLRKITYSFVQTFGASGDGGESELVSDIEMRYGRTTDTTVSHAVMTHVTLNQAWIAGGQPGAVQIDAQYDFSKVVSSHEYVNESRNLTLTLDLSKPCYVYYMSITIEQNSGQTQMYGGQYISFREGGEPFTRVITFEEDGVTIASDQSVTPWGTQEGSGRNRIMNPL